MITYADMICRECGTRIAPREATAESIKANSYADCNYVCPNSDCQTGYSNARAESGRRKILPRAELNVPAEVRPGLDNAISHALNVQNRESKRMKFAFESSEDAVTWTVFRYLQLASAVGAALDLDEAVEDMLFWGVSYPPSATSVRDHLERILLHVLNEDPLRFTEPDVIILLKGSLVFVEVKYGSPNDCQPGYKHFDRYLPHAVDLFARSADHVKATGFYELTRNWVVGSLLARQLGRKFLLINLGPERCRPSAVSFAETVAIDEERNFRFDSWAELLSRIP